MNLLSKTERLLCLRLSRSASEYGIPSSASGAMRDRERCARRPAWTFSPRRTQARDDLVRQAARSESSRLRTVCTVCSRRLQHDAFLIGHGCPEMCPPVQVGQTYAVPQICRLSAQPLPTGRGCHDLRLVVRVGNCAWNRPRALNETWIGQHTGYRAQAAASRINSAGLQLFRAPLPRRLSACRMKLPPIRGKRQAADFAGIEGRKRYRLEPLRGAPPA